MADIKLIVDTQSVDQAIDKISRLRTGVSKTSNTTRQYAKSTQQSTAATRQNTNAVSNAAIAAQKLSNSQRQAGKSTNKFGMVAQQFGYQIGDFFVQVQSGTNAMMAFGQQGTQLAGLMPGLAGAIVGIGLSAFTMLAGGIMRASDVTKQFNNILSETKSALSEVKSVSDIYEQGLVGLRDRYGEVNAELLKHIENLKEVRIQQSLNAQAASVEKLFEALDTLLGSVESNLKSAFDTTNDSARNLEYIIGQIGKQQTFEDQKDAVIAAREEIDRLIAGMDEVTPTAEMVRAKIVEMEDQLRMMVNEAPQASWMDSAIKGVNSLYSRIITAISGVKALKSEAGEQFGEGPPLVFDPASGRYVESGQEGRKNLATNIGLDLGTGTLGRGKSGAGGGGVGRDPAEDRTRAREALTSLIAQYDEGVAEAQKLSQAQETINEAVRNGVITTEQGQTAMQGYIQSLEDTKNPMADFVDNFAKQMADAFTSIVDGSKAASDAFKDMARSILEQAFRMAVVNPIINSIFGGVSGFTKLPSFFANGAAFSGGKVTAFANGGVVNGPTVFPMANGMGLMGEAGPEAVMPLKRGKNGKLGVQADGGGQQPVVINQSFNFSANGDDSVKRIIAQEAPRIANLTQKQILDQRRRGGVMKSTFG